MAVAVVDQSTATSSATHISRIQRFANRAKAVDEPAPRARASLGLNFRDERRAGETICHNRSISRAMQESSRNAYRFGQY